MGEESVSLFTEEDAELAAAFPAGFLWGAATSSYQIEGATGEDGRGLSIWDTFAAIPGKILTGESGEVATDHYHRWPEDLDLMIRLGLTSYRFSIAWPRILPQGQGPVNARGLDFYDRLVDALLEAHIKPFVTLYHWDLPQALQETGGWQNRATAYAFADYAEIVAKRLGDRVSAWITHNEPWCTAYLGYGCGLHAPGLKDRQAALSAGHHVLLSHGLAVARLRSYAPSAQVGITLNFTPVYPADDRPETARDVELAHMFSNRWFVEPLLKGCYPDRFFASMGLADPPIQANDLALISTPIDFLGVNYYSRMVVQGQASQPHADGCQALASLPGATYTAMSWEVYPQGLLDLLLWLHREYAPQCLYITENGAAFHDHWNGHDQLVKDPQRLDYIRSHLRSCAQALQQGIPLKGYFIWSLLDNFEWTHGYSKRFGIIYVDYATQNRILKESGLWYASLIKAHREAHE